MSAAERYLKLKDISERLEGTIQEKELGCMSWWEAIHRLIDELRTWQEEKR